MLVFVQWRLKIKDWQNVDLWQAARIAELSNGSKLCNYLVRYSGECRAIESS
jgi:hypothetical protein